MVDLADMAPRGVIEIAGDDKVTSIRPFRNTDVPKLLEIWVQHWAAFGPPPHLTVAKFEQAVLSRKFFRPALLLVAESDSQVVGWISLAPSEHQELTAVVCAFCFAEAPPAVGQELLAAAETMAQQAGFEQIRIGLIRDETYGYAGLEPMGHGFGIPITDIRTNTLLEESGFHSQGKILRMTASTHGYRPPVSREAMQMRRSARITTQTHVYDQPRHASAMSHLDVESSRLLDLAGDSLAAVKVWFSDPEAEVMSPSQAIVEISDAHARGHLDAAEIYLIGASLQGLADRRVMTVETAIDSDKTDLISQLQSLRFQITDQGAHWEKQL